MSRYQPENFTNLGDWIIWRSEGLLGDFRMPTCILVISNEGVRDGWVFEISEPDIKRILARYKEHVNFWNIGIEEIRRELNSFAIAVKRDYYSTAIIFDNLEPKRIPREQSNQDFL
ncbi:hypothetical protein ACFL96_16520 [Thermoproteota archaeon]